MVRVLAAAVLLLAAAISQAATLQDVIAHHSKGWKLAEDSTSEADDPMARFGESRLLKTKGRPGGKSCRARKKNKEMRTCPNTVANKAPAECKDCVSQCSVFGDPHASPLYSKCTQVVGFKEGNYQFYYVPGTVLAPDGVNITMGVEKVAGGDSGYKGKHWIQRVWLNGKVKMDVKDCPDSSKTTAAQLSKIDATGTFDLYSDKAVIGARAGKKGKYSTKGLDADVHLDFKFGCLHPSEDHGVRQLYIQMSIKDSLDTEEPVPTKEFPPQTTSYFANDFGICTDPVMYGEPGMRVDLERPLERDNYKLVCTRQDPWKTVSGRFCNCAASCGAWGDPHITDFYDCISGTNRACNDLMPVGQAADSPENILYSAEQLFAVQLLIDERCHQIQELKVYMMKESTRAKWLGCTNTAGTQTMLDTFTIADWDVVHIKANDMCQKMQQMIYIPNDPSDTSYPGTYLGANHFDGDVNGFRLGKFGLYHNADTAAVDLVSIDGKDGPTNCAKAKGYDTDGFSKLVDFGGLKVAVNCHQQLSRIWYFNVCVNKENMMVSNWVRNGMELGSADQLPTVRPEWSAAGGMLATLELAGKTSGWCATGTRTSKTEASVFADNTFKNRGVGQQEVFALMDHPDQQIAP